MTQDAIARIRAEFPALAERADGPAPIFLDNPGGTQVPRAVAEAVSQCLLYKNANLGGRFATSRAADGVYDEAHRAMADFFNARSPREVVFGQNMTTLTLHMARSIGRTLAPGDEIIVTDMEHDANATPWLLMARDRGLTVKTLTFDREAFEFDLSALDALLSERSKLLCLNHASNMLGTINDVKTACAKARAAGAMTYIDSVQFAPHGAIDVQALGCDFLVCSPYKFYGPHMGVLWGREERLATLEPYKLRAADDGLPGRFETGTLNHEAMAGVTAAVDHFAWIGRSVADRRYRLAQDGAAGRRAQICAAMAFLQDYEIPLTQRLIDGLLGLKGIRIHGITNPNAGHRRVPTVSFSAEGQAPAALAEAMGRAGVQVWHGHNYALDPARSLGLLEAGGAVRIGLAQYNTAEEVDQALRAIDISLAAAH